MRTLVTTPRFERKLKLFLRKHPELATRFQDRLAKLQRNINESSLRSHALTGRLKGSWAASLTYEYRIVFSFNDREIILEAIGAHDEVY